MVGWKSLVSPDDDDDDDDDDRLILVWCMVYGVWSVFYTHLMLPTQRTVYILVVGVSFHEKNTCCMLYSVCSSMCILEDEYICHGYVFS